MPTEQERAEELQREGQRQYDAGSYAAAAAAIRSALMMLPEKLDWRFQLARTLVKDRRPEEAHVVMMTLLEQPSPKAKWFALAGHTAPTPKEQVGYLRQAIASDTPRPAWKYALARLLASNGDFDEAASIMRELLLARDVPARWCSEAAMIYWRLGRLAEGRLSIERALALERSPPPLWRAMKSEFEARLASSVGNVGSEVSANFYDHAYRGAEKYQRSPEHSSYMPVWQGVSSHLKRIQPNSLLDIGCGPGQFAEFISASLPSTSYTGVDFSEEAIRLAKERCPGLEFAHSDVLRDNFVLQRNYDAVVALEVLEHIERDLDLLSRFQGKPYFIGSVPDFDSFGHVRFFSSAEQVRERYQSHFDSLQVSSVELKDGATLFLLLGQLIGTRANV